MGRRRATRSGARSGKRKHPASPRLGAKLVLALVCLVAPPLALEALARGLLPSPPPNLLPGLSRNEVEDDALLWRHRPGFPGEGEDGPINALGMRGPEVALERPPGRRRVLSLGESTTYGARVDWRETYSHVLEQEVRAAGRDVEVLNADVRAWSTVQSLRYLELEGGRLAPDVVLFYHELNDFLPTTFRGISIPGAGLSDSEMMARTGRLAWRCTGSSASRICSGPAARVAAPAGERGAGRAGAARGA